MVAPDHDRRLHLPGANELVDRKPGARTIAEPEPADPGRQALEVDAIRRETDQFISILKSMGPLTEGSVITIDFVDGATQVGFNGAPKGSVAGEAFNRALTRVWIGDEPVQPDLRKAMLGG